MSSDTSLIASGQHTTLSTRVPLEEIDRLDALSLQCVEIQRTQMTPFRRTFLMAAGMQQLRQLISPAMMMDVMALQGSPLGFKTDQDEKGGYPAEVVKEAVIEATLRGLRLVGNEINILSKRMYAAKDGMKRLVRDWPGLTNLKTQLGVPRKAEGFTVVPCMAAWKLDGEEQTLDCTAGNSIPIRVNDGMIVDAILGKAERKLFARIYERLLGYDHGLIESDGTATTAPDASLPGPNDENINTIVAEYVAKIELAKTSAEIPLILREAAKDKRLDDRGHKEVLAAANARGSELRQLERQNKNRPAQQQKPAQQQTFVDASIEDHSILIAEWTDQINQIDSFTRYQEIAENAKKLQPPIRGYVEKMLAEKLKKIG